MVKLVLQKQRGLFPIVKQSITYLCTSNEKKFINNNFTPSYYISCF